MSVGITAEEEEEGMGVTACLARLGDKGIGSVTDAELTTLPAEADATHAGQTNYLRGVTAAETEVVTEVMVVMATEEVVVVVVVTEAPQPSSPATGTAQIAVLTTLPAVKHATNAMLPSKCMCP